MKQFASLESRSTLRKYTAGVVGLLVLAALCLTSLASYLLFHTLVEMLTIVVAVSTFLIVWNARRFLTNNYVAFLGIAYMFVAAIDLAHTLTYSGMAILPQFTSNVPTQLWIAARALQSVSFLAAPLFFTRKLRFGVAIPIYFLASSLLIALILRGNSFPVCFIEGVGLTLFKKLSEYAISLLLVGGWFLLYRNRTRLERSVFAWLSLSILLAVAAELAFTFYVSVYGLSNLVGHVLKLVSFFALYKAIIETSLRTPYQMLFRELKASELAFEKERDFAEVIINTAQAIVLVLDAQGRIVHINPYTEKISGYRLEEVKGEDWFSTFLPQRDQPTIRQLFKAALSGQATQGNVNAIVTKFGEERQIEWSDRTYEDPDGSTGLISIGRDITDLKKAEQVLLRNQQRYKKAQTMRQVGNWEYDPVTTHFWASDEAKRIYGFEIDIEDFTTDKVEGCIPERERVHQALIDLVEHNKEYDLVFDIITNDNGIRKTIHSIAEAERDTQGNAMLITGVISDTSESKKKEAQARNTQRLESIGTLASGVAHEINNPLMGMLNYAELVKDEVQDQKLVDYLTQIGTEGNRIATIVRNLLSFSRQVGVAYGFAAMKDIVEESLSLVGATMRKEQIAIEIDISEELPQVKCHNQEIQQVIMNLLTNAHDALNTRYSKFDENKIIRITASAFEKDGEPWIRTTVEDHGSGIPADVADRIFDPFFSTKSRHEGTGLGLSISFGIVSEHAGELTMESNPGEYTRFHMDLPQDGKREDSPQEEAS
jgi:PAS domain S-box-containing protein